jgi:hypothetical protein
MVKGKVNLLTLKEASELTGIAVPALRMRIKHGKIEGVKTQTRHGEAWFIKADTVTELKDLELNPLNTLTLKRFSGEKVKGEFNPEGDESPVLRAKEDVIQGLKDHLKTYEALLTTFQGRIINLESEKSGLEGQLRLLPAPPEVVTSNLEKLMKENEEKTQAVERAQEILKKARVAYDQYKTSIVELKTKLAEEERTKEAYRIQWELAQAELKKPWWKKLFGIK